MLSRVLPARAYIPAHKVMTHMKRLLLTGILAAFTSSALAQSAPQTGINAAMIKMFGDIKAFTAKAHVRMLDKTQKEVSAMPMTMALTMALRDGRMRTDMDLTEVKMAGVPVEAVQMMKSAGMDKMVSLIQPDKKLTTLIYPNMQAYAEMPVNEEEVSGTVQSKDLGEEKIDGHTCKKVQLSATDSKGKTQEALVWQAKDLKNFPIQMEMKQKENTVVVKFQEPKLETPAASQFEVPAGYSKYPTFQAMLQAAMLKMLNNNAPK
jgi:hypothetical protein